MGKKKEFKITKKWLVRQNACKAGLKCFLEFFPKGKCTIREFLKIAEENAVQRKIVDYVYWLIHIIPKNPEPLVLEEYTGGNIFYNGDVHLKGRFECEDYVICKNLRVDGDMYLGGRSLLCAEVVNAQNLNIDKLAEFCAEVVNVQNLDIRGCATLWVQSLRAQSLIIKEDAEIKPRFLSPNWG